MNVRERAGFTRIEVMLVIAILVVGTGLALPAVIKVREAHARTKTLCQLKQVGLCIHNANDTYKRLPPAWGEYLPRESAAEPQKSARATIHVWLLPFMEQDDLYKQLTQSPPGGKNDDATRRVWQLPMTSAVVETFVSPMDFTNSGGTVTLNGKVYGVQNYAVNIRVFGPLSGNGAQPGVEPASDAFDRNGNIKDIFVDGTSNTITFATRYGLCGTGASTWSQPGTATLGPFGGLGAFFGSTISPTLDANGDNASGDNTTFQIAPTPAGGTNPCNPIYAQSFDTWGIQVALGDGSTRTIASTISIRTWARALIPNDRFELGSDW